MKNDILHFSKSERLGIAVLIILLIISMVLPFSFSLFHSTSALAPPLVDSFLQNMEKSGVYVQPIEKKRFLINPNQATVDTLLQWGIPEKLAKTWVNFREKVSIFKEKKDLKRLYGMSDSMYSCLAPWLVFPEKTGVFSKVKIENKYSPLLFSFDPNELNEDSLSLLGISAAVSKRIVNYRNKGGSFKVKTDLLRIYDFDTLLFHQLASYMTLPATLEPKEKGGKNPRARDSTVALFLPRKRDGFVDVRIDINLADTADWKQLPGIGSYYARKIIAFRTALGGFKGVEQLRETYNLPDSVFLKIQPFLYFQTPVRKMQLNHVSPEELARHPYINRRQATAIKAWIQQHGSIRDSFSLMKIKAIPLKEWKKILPYLSFD